MDVKGAKFTIEYRYGDKYHEKTRLSNIKWKHYEDCLKFASNTDKACKIFAVDSKGTHYIKWVIGKNHKD